MRIILATTSNEKAKTMKEELSKFETMVDSIVSLKDIGYTKEIEETGTSFSENAEIKCRAIAAEYPDDIIIGNDAGFCIDFFDGAPGLYSHRFMGEDTPIDEKCKIILEKMKYVPYDKRDCRLQASTAVIVPGNNLISIGIAFTKGKVATEISNIPGYAYDRIFYLPQYEKTMSEITDEQRKHESHHIKSLRAVMSDIEEYFEIHESATTTE